MKGILTMKMLGNVLEKLAEIAKSGQDVLGLIYDLLVKLTSVDGPRWKEELKLFLRKELEKKVDAVKKILELVSKVRVSLTTGKFVAKDKFVQDTSRQANVKISYLGGNFKSWFLAGDGKTETVSGPHPKLEVELHCHKLRQSSVDGPIIAELGGAEKSETTLSEMFSLMEKQGKGEDGVLLNNGYANIFYIKDGAGVLRAVRVFWNDERSQATRYSQSYCTRSTAPSRYLSNFVSIF